MRTSWLRAAAALLLCVAACSDNPTEPALAPVEIVVASGDGQFGALGQALPARLQVVVSTASTGKPKEDVGVLWEVVEGDATFAGSRATLTDESGSAFASIRLGGVPGDVVIKASVTEQESATVNFTLFAVERPVLDALSIAEAPAGATITLLGNSFSPTPDHNVVLFSGIRGRVTSASTTQLEVVVPTCLPTRSVQVTAQLGTVKSEARALEVVGGTQTTVLAVGEVVDVSDDSTFPCLRMPGLGGASYLVLAMSASTIGAAQHGFQLTGLVGAGLALAQPAPAARAIPTDGGVPPQTRFEELLRRREAALVREGVARTRSAPLRVESVVPSVGDRRTFQVFNADKEFDEVRAVAEYVGSQAVLYVDETAPAGGLGPDDLEEFARRFDEVVYPTVTDAFGGVSDLDGNQRVVILFTPTVNRLTRKGSVGFVGGFYYGIDLLPEREGSNSAEIFYSLVPDPTGQFSDPRPKDRVLEVTPAILAHEFQHMVHFNERVLVLEAASTEALWLSEGLAQMAEELVAREYELAENTHATELFREGNLERARRYLLDPSAVSLLGADGIGSLAERGGGWLHVLYLAAQKGGSVLGQLTRTTTTETDNVTVRAGVPWEKLLADWWTAIYVDGHEAVESRLTYPGLDLRELLGDDYVLQPETLGSADFTRSGSLWSSSVQYYIVVPTLQGSVTLRLGGEAGGASPSGAALRMRVIRLN